MLSFEVFVSVVTSWKFVIHNVTTLQMARLVEPGKLDKRLIAMGNVPTKKATNKLAKWPFLAGYCF